MDKERLYQIMSLVIDMAPLWDIDRKHLHAATLEVDNNGCHVMRVYENVNEDSKNYRVYTTSWRPSAIHDPNFDEAEAHMRRLLNAVDG